MSISELKGDTVTAKLWLPVSEVESQALTQLRNIASLPWVAHVAVMPDCHFGKGATVGSVVGMRGAVSPAAVGVDIGCGMGAMRTNLAASELPDNLKDLRSEIERVIPVGFNSHEVVHVPGDLAMRVLKNEFKDLFSEFKDLDPYVSGIEQKAKLQVGTLGGGNHFIELCVDTHGQVWMMLHSGSRNIGKTLAEVHMWKAKELGHNAALVDPDLAVFLSGTPEMQAYRRDLYWAQRYAMLNRKFMFELYKDALRKFVPHVTFASPVLCHHNYVSEENHFGEDLFVTRKGAISAKKGEMGIIPGSMGAKSFIVRGLGNEDALSSASHGAGRQLSRGAAKRKYNLADLVEQTKGVECRKDADVIDEIPGAYKDIEQVMRNQSDLVEIVHELKQVLCVKG